PSAVEETPSTTALGSLGKALTEYLINIEPVQQLIVLRTGAGQAQILGIAIDRARLPEVVGTIAGDDTILIIARDAKNALAVVKKLRELAR
ncbi:MAG: arginine repressor, partial [Acidobacteriota bacterium]|nr:arginine repressor [Acidobacteriota bacterium]